MYKDENNLRTYIEEYPEQAKKPRDISPVEAQLEEQEANIKRIFVNLENLGRRLDPILGPILPQDTDEVMPDGPGLVGSLAIKNRKLKQIGTWINDLTDRLQI